jgi:hypothetical protein
MEVPHIPTAMTVLISVSERHHFIDRSTAVGDLLDPPINQTIDPTLLITVNVASERPLTYAQQTGRFFLRQPAFRPRPIRLLKPHLPDLL